MSLVEDTEVPTNKNLRHFLPKGLRKRAVQCYRHYLQHPGHTRFEETLRHVFAWPGMRAMVRSYVKQCQSCQFNKKQKLQYGHVPVKTIKRKPWEALCVDLIGPYTLKGKDGAEIDFMYLTMINPRVPGSVTGNISRTSLWECRGIWCVTVQDSINLIPT